MSLQGWIVLLLVLITVAYTLRGFLREFTGKGGDCCGGGKGPCDCEKDRNQRNP